jgi:hypothetical protein
MSAEAVELMQDNVLRSADEQVELHHHVVRMLRNPEYLEAVSAADPTGLGQDPEEVLAKYL